MSSDHFQLNNCRRRGEEGEKENHITSPLETLDRSSFTQKEKKNFFFSLSLSLFIQGRCQVLEANEGILVDIFSPCIYSYRTSKKN